MAATYTIRLDDDVSGPAKRAARGLDKVRAALGRVRSGARAAGSALGKIASGLKMVAAAAVAAAAVAVAQLGAAFVKTVAKSAAFQENVEFALTRFLGDAGLARKELAAIRKLSDKLGISYMEAASNFKEFISAGFTRESAKELIALKADALALADTAQKVANVESAFQELAKSMAAGRMEADGLQRITENLPINKLQIMTKLAPKMGKSVKELMKMDITKLPIDKLVAAIKEASKEALGASKLGEVAIRKTQETWTGAMDAMKARARNLFFDFAESAKPLIRSITKGLGEIEFDKTKAIASFKSIVKQIKPIVEPIIAAMKPIFSGMFAGFEAGMKAVQPMMAAIAKGLGKPESVATMAEGFRVLGTIIGGIAAIVVSAMSLAVAAIGFFAAGVAQVGPAVSAAWAAVTGAFEGIGESITGALDSAVAAFTGLGTDMVGGLVSGIQGAASAVVAAVVGVVTAAIAAGKASLGISSPSKVFAGMGEQIAAGMSEGMVAGTPGVATTTRDMVSASTGAAAGASQNTYNNRISSSPSINVSGAGSPRETAEAVLKIQLDEARALLEQLGASMGASTV